MKSMGDSLIKPLTVFYWKLTVPQYEVESLFSQETEVKRIENPEEFINFLYRHKVSYLVLGLLSLEDFKREWMPILSRISLNQRRKMFVVLILPDAKTLDPWQTFLLSVNLLVNVEDTKGLSLYLQRAKSYFYELYEPYFRAMRNYLEELI